MKRPSVVACFMAGASVWSLTKRRCERLHMLPVSDMDPCGRCENVIEAALRKALNGPTKQRKRR